MGDNKRNKVNIAVCDHLKIIIKCQGHSWVAASLNKCCVDIKAKYILYFYEQVMINVQVDILWK